MLLQKWRAWSGARLSLTAGGLAGVLVLLLPLLWVRGPTESGENLLGKEAPAETAVPVETSAEPAEASSADEGYTVRVLTADGAVEEQSMADYLWSVVAAEMPASFEPDALRAQAVCARTYTLWKANHNTKHKEQGADVCTDSGCCQAYTTKESAAERWGSAAAEYTEKISAAVADTAGVIAAYDGAPIQAVFFSSAAGATEDASAVWGNALPYLVSVDSPEGDEVPNYHSQAVLSREEVKTLVTAAYPGADLSGEPEGWFQNASYTASGRVASIDVGGVTLSGGAARNLFSLRSACFTVVFADGGFTFSVTGYGHGVGMSQYGANAMAKAGSGWQEILTHYYTGAELRQGW